MEELKEYIQKHKLNQEKSKDFVSYLLELKEKHGFVKDSDLYNKAGISRQTWSNIINCKSKEIPTLNNLLKLVFALQLDTHECKYLLKKVGYTLSSSSEYSLVIRYCIENKIYDPDKVNELLMQHGYINDKYLI